MVETHDPASRESVFFFRNAQKQSSDQREAESLRASCSQSSF